MREPRPILALSPVDGRFRPDPQVPIRAFCYVKQALGTGRKAIFLDRDGTLNKDVHYLIKFEDFELLPGVAEALRLLQDLRYRLFVVSNQSGVARGLFPFESVEDLHRRITAHLASQGIHLEEMVFCPHHPQGTVERFTRDCDCRKPKAGMLRYLAGKYDLDLGESFMVGDSVTDAEAGLNAGAKAVWLKPEPGGAAVSGQVDNRANIKEFGTLLEFAESLRTRD
jgi:D-glycero-D-manno-heptose 1,7-bisphosphate phosphatase